MGKKLAGVFGMFEMEAAARRILDICKVFREQRFGVNDMENETERDGFVELLWNAWLEHDETYNGSFYMSDRFIEKTGYGEDNEISERTPEKQ
jgi:hypothetical protein